MSPRSQLLFLVLVMLQAAHSVEEYSTRLFEVFAPARFVSGLVSENLAVGFAAINVSFIAVGAWCYLRPVRAGGRVGWRVAAVWVVIELVNGIGHLVIAASNGRYFSGSVTAVSLVIAAGSLAFSLLADSSVEPPA